MKMKTIHWSENETIDIVWSVEEFEAGCGEETIQQRSYSWRKNDMKKRDGATEFLKDGFLSDIEKDKWISKVEQYVMSIKKSLKSQCFIQFMVQKEKEAAKRFHNIYIKDSKIYSYDLCDEEIVSAPLNKPEISFLHTGSIPQQFSKPKMMFGDVGIGICNSFPELRSDHDVMFVLEHLPVTCRPTRGDRTPFSLWLEAEMIPIDGKEEFVRIIPMTNSKSGVAPWLPPYLKNTLANEFLSEAIKNSFLTISHSTHPDHPEWPFLTVSEDLAPSVINPFHQSEAHKVSLTRKGPSVNITVTAFRDQAVFDCDFLLCLPVRDWPSPALEWKSRYREWPCKETVQRLTCLPCHLIAKPAREGDDKTWRFSFSQQEIELAQILPPKARLCYVGLKYIFKRHLKAICKDLKSYHMLTIFLWFMEKENPTKWDDHTSTKHMLALLLLEVAERLDTGSVPHYFIRTLNLLAGTCEEGNDFKLVSRKLVNVVEKDQIDEHVNDILAFHTSCMNSEYDNVTEGIVGLKFAHRNSSDLFIVDIDLNSVASRIGLQLGDKILQVNSHQFIPPLPANWQCVRGVRGETVYVHLEIGSRQSHHPFHEEETSSKEDRPWNNITVARRGLDGFMLVHHFEI
eukprot:GFUD01067151.1.p1 GENE.GFUD01067151.1~~GFUD01067151.1.p1  ORF type:complete len:691 (-),score=155.86 GFUD01067151.1:217-2097(-)